MSELVLASASPRRRRILEHLGYDFLVRPAEVDETQRDGEDALAYVERLALAKATADARAGELVLGADTIVAVDGRLLGKPSDRDDAIWMLRRLSGREHEVSTGVAVHDVDSDRTETATVTTVVAFAQLSDREIEWYVDSGEPMDKAGGYAIQGLGRLFVVRIDGDYTNVVGLPVPTVYALLNRLGGPDLPPTPPPSF